MNVPATAANKPSYVKEMLLHQGNIYTFLVSALAGTLLTIPFGVGIGALPLLAYGAGATIASLFIPSHPLFRARVDARKHRERREGARGHLLFELGQQFMPDHPNWATYRRICERVRSLNEIVTNHTTTLSSREVEQLDDATVSFLGLWLALEAICQRERATHENTLAHKLAAVQAQLQDEPSDVERRRLERARGDLERVLKSRKQLDSQKASIEAAMLSLSDTFEDVFQNVMANPQSEDISRQLAAAVERLHVEEELSSAIDADIGEMLGTRRQLAKMRTGAHV